MNQSDPARCCVCGARDASPDPYYWLWRGRRFTLYRCGNCTHQFVYPSVSVEDQAEIYSDNYFSKDGDWVCGVFQESYVEAESQLRREAKAILSMLPTSSGKLLDIGCAGGVFLDEARSWGFDVVGIELNRSMAQHAANTYHLDIIDGRIEDVPGGQWSLTFDVITLLDCLEHVPDPYSALAKIHNWLRTSGSVFIRGPLSNSPLGRFKEGMRRALRLAKQLPGYPLDANAFNKRSMATLLDLTGFDGVRWIGETDDFANLLARRKAGG